MPIPVYKNFETPILHELFAVGGSDDVRFLYERLVPYFPALSDAEIGEIKIGANKSWRAAVQKAGKILDEKNHIRRRRGIWTLTEKGRQTIESESSGFIIAEKRDQPLTHQKIQEMLVEIGEILGFYAEAEFEFYDVVWRENRKSGRISHVFEVQSKGNIDSAFAKLKRAHDAQRSKPFLILASERDTNRARQSLSREFSQLQTAVTILSFAQLRKIHENLKNIADFLPKFLEI